MGFLFTFLYIVISYLTPPVIFGPLAEYHVEIVFVILAIVFSIPSLKGSGLGRAPQTIALVGMMISIVLSLVITGWLGGAVAAFYGFLQPTLAFCLIALNCKKKIHFQLIIFALLASSTFFMLQGIHDLRNDIRPSDFIYDEGPLLRRIRGLGFVHDPNDFAQILVSLIPCIFLWRRKSSLANVILIGVPVGILLTGMYLTHSRGSILALLAVTVVAARRKIGTIPSLIIAGALFSASFAVNWSGGRDISMQGGSDRLDLWAQGLAMIRSHPLFGVGLNGFPNYTGGLTAHNSIVVCAGETGIVGLFFWVLFVTSTLRLGVLLGFKPSASKSPEVPAAEPGLNPWFARVQMAQRTATEPMLAIGGAPGRAPWRHNDVPATAPPWPIGSPPLDARKSGLPAEEIARMARLVAFSLTGMLVAGWFLSRAFSQWLFLYCGMMYAISRLQPKEGTIVLPDERGSLLKWSAVITVLLLMGLYVLLRFRVVSG